MYLGSIDQQNCYLSKHSPNSSVLITGQSGTGKTVRMQQMEINSAIEGKTVLVLETSGSHSNDQIFTGIRSLFFALANRIDACKDGLAIPLLPPVLPSDTLTPAHISFVNSVVNAFAIPAKLGNQQITVLRNAIIYAIQNAELYSTETDAIISGLKLQKRQGAELYERFWSLFNYQLFRPCSYTPQLADGLIMKNSHAAALQLVPGRINIIDLLELDDMTQMIAAEMLLFSLFTHVRKQKNAEACRSEFVIFIDEFQSYPLGVNSMIKKLLHEGRKYGISLVLATQSTKIFPASTVSSINQAAAKLYFKPDRSEIRRLAKEIFPENPKAWEKFLWNLKTGESIAAGLLQIGNSKISRPIILQ